MNHMQGRFLRSAVTLALLLPFFSSTIARADKWIEPTAEELKMTSQAQVPGAAAVYLYREETTDDKLHFFSIYVRLKVLTDKGKEFGNVELSYANQKDGGGYTVNDISGRTIHPDGTVIPFTGKAFEKLIEKSQTTKYMAKVFSLPSVEVGSIIEYRYTLRYDDHYFMAPQWFIQSELFTRKAHYKWEPTSEQLVSSDDRGQVTNSIAWTPILPKGVEVKLRNLPGSDQRVFEVNAEDVPPAPDEELMPPISSLTYRVLFYYSPYRSNAEFWKEEGKHWSKLQDKFIGPGRGVSDAVKQLVAASDTPDQKLRKIYAAVMELENTDFTHEHSAAEEKSQGLKEIHNTDDILARKRGASDQLALLFVAMARAAGFKAYAMTVTNRDRHIFLPTYFSLSQFDDTIALVNVDGKELTFDPGSRYCPYGHMAWKHTMVGGLRQADSGAVIAYTQGEPYTSSQVQRIADLKIDESGLVTGTVKMTFIGASALRWRQIVLRGDATALEHDLRTRVEELLPSGMEVKVSSISKVADYEQPLVADFTVKGNIGSSTGKRLLLPANVFQVNSKPTFSHEKREVAVAFDYPYDNKDAIRIVFPATFAVESLPASESYQYVKSSAYAFKTESTPTSVTIRRELAMADILFPPTEYQALRSYYGKFETKDQENVVLRVANSSDKPKSSGN
jgi:Domain of Unknown Function with PDB structure (DUF3857)/Transglutaminase-like superfamily